MKVNNFKKTCDFYFYFIYLSELRQNRTKEKFK